MPRRLRYLVLALAGLMLSSCAAYTATSGQVVLKDDSKAADVRIGGSDRTLIADYYMKHVNRKKAPASARLVKGNALPSGVQGEPLPRELEQKLSPLPSPYIRVRVGPDIVLMDRKTRVVFDVVYGIAH